jgi:uncharacterized protein (TIGR02284 family)
MNPEPNASANLTLAATLNGLIATLKCSEEGFRGAAKRFLNPKLRETFVFYALERERFASEFQDLVANLGGVAELNGTTACAVHRDWQNLKDAIQGINDLGILAEAEVSETSIAKYLQDAISGGIPDNIREMLESQIEDILKARDHITELQTHVVTVAGQPTAKTE